MLETNSSPGIIFLESVLCFDVFLRRKTGRKKNERKKKEIKKTQFDI